VTKEVVGMRRKLGRILDTARGYRRSPGPSGPPLDGDAYRNLAKRVEHLEAALEGLQDAVYRQDTMHDRQIADLRRGQRTRADGQ
jgi:hypothetical protein